MSVVREERRWRVSAAQLALCREPDAPRGRCRDCRLFGAAQHPDFIELHPIEDSKLIRVEQVRELSEQLVLTAHAGGATVALLSPADSMNANAANALLKSLEEPRAGVTLILVSADAFAPARDHPEPLPAAACCHAGARPQCELAGAHPWPRSLGHGPRRARGRAVRGAGSRSGGPGAAQSRNRSQPERCSWWPDGHSGHR